MADLADRRLRALAYVDKDKIKQKLGKTWTDYEKAAKDFADAKTVASKAKRRSEEATERERGD